MLVQMKAQRDIKGALDAVDTDLAIALRRMAIATAKECTAIVDGQVERGSGAELANIKVSAERPRWTGPESAILCAGYAHNPQEWPQRHDCRNQRTGVLALKFPVKKVRLTEPVL